MDCFMVQSALCFSEFSDVGRAGHRTLGSETKNRKTRNAWPLKFFKYFLFSSQNISHHTYSRKTIHTGRFFKEISMCVCTKCASLNILFIFANDTLCLSHLSNKKKY